MEQKIKLTGVQNKVVYFLQQGGILVTGCEMSGAIVCWGKSEFKINNKTFWNLVKKDIIFQENRFFNYILTEYGKGLKTQPVFISIEHYQKIENQALSVKTEETGKKI